LRREYFQTPTTTPTSRVLAVPKVGESVARVELAVLFKELLTLTPQISSNGDIKRMKTSLFADLHRMPVKD
jgi:hypothetical protein